MPLILTVLLAYLVEAAPTVSSVITFCQNNICTHRPVPRLTVLKKRLEILLHCLATIDLHKLIGSKRQTCGCQWAWYILGSWRGGQKFCSHSASWLLVYTNSNFIGSSCWLCICQPWAFQTLGSSGISTIYYIEWEGCFVGRLCNFPISHLEGDGWNVGTIM